jgi:transposase
LKKGQEAAFMAMVTAHPNWTLKEFGEAWQEQTGVWLPKSTLHEHLTRLGGRFKKRVWSPKNVAK